MRLSTKMEPPIVGLASKAAYAGYILAAAQSALTERCLPCPGVLLATSNRQAFQRIAGIAVTSKVLEMIRAAVPAKK